ncbi:myb/SANT-like DNA-binding domain-containing protein 4 [Austrofundulus limnaeus]|uniref:Myb/SANT-like DNA-binding domain-containing protein 4 n=1 Tax=Austrofundulus limnaeus TaxID=52670 RepID=A0A2I4BP00_AUSLI|nr:PREDICTED: myb/SANT-like DNA-binding domain-containing protein 4 [Austrofundulus limnaeus]
MQSLCVLARDLHYSYFSQPIKRSLRSHRTNANTAVNELKRQAWEEVAQGVNALGERETRTATEVKRRYLDWRALMKKKELRAELNLSPSSSSSLTVKTECDQSSPEHEAAPQGSDQLLELPGFQRDCQSDWPELVGVSEPSTGQSVTTHPGMKVEDDIIDYKLDRDAGDADMDDVDIPSLLSDIESCGEGHADDVFPHNNLNLLSSSKDLITTTTRCLLPVGGLAGPGEDQESSGAGSLLAVEKQRLEMEKQRLAVETERLAVEKERLQVERERLRQVEVERERLLVERERLRLLLTSRSEHIQGPPSSTAASLFYTHGEAEENSWVSAVNLEAARMNLERERLLLFKFEAGRLQIEKERLQVEKDRMRLHKDHQPVKS